MEFICSSDCQRRSASVACKGGKSLYKTYRYTRTRQSENGGYQIDRRILHCGDAEVITGLKEHTSRDLLSLLLAEGILGSDSQKGAVSLRFPVKALDVLFPQLFPQV